MSRSAALRWHRRVRMAWMLVLALCVVMQPALSAVGRVHDAFEHAGTALQHHEAPEAHAGEDAGHGGDPIHVLMHYAHCCASSTALVLPMASLPASDAAKASPLPMPATGHAQTRPGHPFRPPIQA